MDNIKPNALTRYGTLLTFVILLLTGVLTWFIKYPETVSSQAKLTGANAPKPIIAKQTARLTFLNKKNGVLVDQGDVIGSLESTANLAEVSAFFEFVDSIQVLLQQGNTDEIKLLMKKEFGHLGELQGDYQAFMQIYIPYHNYVIGDYSKIRRTLLNKDMEHTHDSHAAINEQGEPEYLPLNLAMLKKNIHLLEEKLLSEEEFRALASQNIGKKKGQPQMTSGYISSATQLNSIQKEIVELDKEIASQRSLFQQAVYNLKSKIDDWRNKYLLVANTKGKLAFTSFLQEDQIVEAGKIISYVIPVNSEIYAESLVSQETFGKIKKGQMVFLTFNAYPSHEYGKVIGSVEYISPVPVDNGHYLVKILLPERLKTNYNKEIPFMEGLTIQADFVTKDMRLAESLYYNVIRQIKK